MILRLALVCAACAIGWSQPCTLAAREYQERQFQVRTVKIATPFAWLPFESQLIRGLREKLPQQPGPFDAAAYDAGVPIVQAAFRELQPIVKIAALERISATVTVGGLHNCADNTLDVVYHVFTTNVGFYRSNTFEHPGSELNRAVPRSRLAAIVDRLRPEPVVGYNDARGLYGGSRFSIAQPIPLADRLAVQAIGSPSSLELGAALTASRDYKDGAVRHADWRLGYRYSDLPAGDDARLLRRKLVAQYSGASRPLGVVGLVLRAGGSVEGGRQQTYVPGVITAGDLAAGYGSLKAYAGGTFRTGGHDFKASYGFQGGKAAGYYHKQVGDVGYTLRFQPVSHHPVSIETEFAGGSLGGRAPAAERFFGGNVSSNFIEGNDWHISAAPYIRSVSENRLGAQSGLLGGTAFYSANLTVAAAAYVRTLIPPELLVKENREIIEAGFNQEFQKATAALANAYIGNDASFLALISRLEPLEQSLAGMKEDLLKRKAAAAPGSPEAGALAALCAPASGDPCGGGRLGRALKTVRAARQDVAEKNARLPSDIRDLVLGFPAAGDDPALPSRLADLSQALGSLVTAMGTEAAGPVADTHRQLDQTQAELVKLHQAIDFASANKKAAAMLDYARRVEHQLLDEANLYAISPVGLLDAARIWPAGPLNLRTRWGAGGGVRFTLVNVDFTLTYARLLRSYPGESPHAVTFSMNITNLFR